MKEISKMVYEAPFIEIVPMEQNLMEVLSGVDYDGDGDKDSPIGDHDPGGMGKEFGFEEYEGWDFEGFNYE